MDDTTLDTLSGEHQVKIGGQIAATIGPMGREAEVAFNLSEKGAGGTYTYTFSKGVFGGISLETAIMNVRSKENERFYGKAAKAKEILWEDVVEAPKGKGIEEVSKFYGYCGLSLHSCESISHKIILSIQLHQKLELLKEGKVMVQTPDTLEKKNSLRIDAEKAGAEAKASQTDVVEVDAKTEAAKESQ